MARTSLLDRMLKEKETLLLEIDAPARLAAHRAVIERKPMIRRVFEEFHQELMRLDRKYFEGVEGVRVEVGAGVWPVRTTYAEVLATDVVAAEHLDRVVDAEDIDLRDASVRAIYAQNCFHHLHQPARFLAELERVLAPGGGAILIEPYHGPVASLLFPRLFKSEGFDKRAASWTTADGGGPMQGANQALSYVVFVRDRARFEREFPSLELVYSRPLPNYLRYLLSGGLNFRALAPSLMDQPLALLEGLLEPLSPVLALHQILVVRRKRRPESPLPS